MKHLQGLGIGSKRRQAEPLTVEEELLWQKVYLDPTAHRHFYTPCYLLTECTLSGSEHRQLRNDPCQIDLVEREGERSYLRYTE